MEDLRRICLSVLFRIYNPLPAGSKIFAVPANVAYVEIQSGNSGNNKGRLQVYCLLLKDISQQTCCLGMKRNLTSCLIYKEKEQEETATKKWGVQGEECGPVCKHARSGIAFQK